MEELNKLKAENKQLKQEIDNITDKNYTNNKYWNKLIRINIDLKAENKQLKQEIEQLKEAKTK